MLVLTRWTLRAPRDSTELGGRHLVTAVNGKSWPHTEQFSYQVGDSIHWRVINGSALPHPMHLHGFYFRVERKGTLTGDTILARPRLVVTENLTVGQTLQLSWRADRAGNWLFHCHLLVHMSPTQRLDRLSDSASASLLGVNLASVPARQPEHAGHVMKSHASAGMAGLIVGIRVLPRGGSAANARPAAPRRTLRLFANQRAGVFAGEVPGYSFVLQEGAREPARDSVPRVGSTIVLRRGESAQITVFNRLSVPLSVHWHGLELDSYFDGVGDWSGSAGSIARPIASEDSFVVRITPPRAGTFMYHVHSEEGRELASGLYGALLVVEGPASLDSRDRVVLISDAGPQPAPTALVNGSTLPPIAPLTAGRPHRLRLIGIASNAAREVSLLQGADTAQWRLLARDGAEIVGDAEPLTRALRPLPTGTIADYEVTPSKPGELTLRVITRGPGGVVREALRIPIVVSAPRVTVGARSAPARP